MELYSCIPLLLSENEIFKPQLADLKHFLFRLWSEVPFSYCISHLYPGHWPCLLCKAFSYQISAGTSYLYTCRLLGFLYSLPTRINLSTIGSSVADPGCLSRIRVFSHPGSQKTWGGKKKFLFYLFSYLFVAFHPC